jgi:hypothetical protein
MAELSESIDTIKQSFKDLANSSNQPHMGGDDEQNENTPTGGFLPIIRCTRTDIVKEENKNREFITTKKQVVSIKNIIFKRKNTDSIFK